MLSASFTFILFIDVTVAFARRTYGVNEEDGSVQPALVLSQPVSTSITVMVSSSDISARGSIKYVHTVDVCNNT